MGVIQGAINQTLGTAAGAAALGTFVSQEMAPEIAKENISEVDKNLQKAREEALKTGEQEFTERHSAEDIYLESKGVDTTNESDRQMGLAELEMNDPELYKDLYKRADALKELRGKQEAKVVSISSIKERMQDVAEGKLKATSGRIGYITRQSNKFAEEAKKEREKFDKGGAK